MIRLLIVLLLVVVLLANLPEKLTVGGPTLVLGQREFANGGFIADSIWSPVEHTDY